MRNVSCKTFLRSKCFWISFSLKPHYEKGRKSFLNCFTELQCFLSSWFLWWLTFGVIGNRITRYKNGFAYRRIHCCNFIILYLRKENETICCKLVINQNDLWFRMQTKQSVADVSSLPNLSRKCNNHNSHVLMRFQLV